MLRNPKHRLVGVDCSFYVALFIFRLKTLSSVNTKIYYLAQKPKSKFFLVNKCYLIYWVYFCWQGSVIRGEWGLK